MVASVQTPADLANLALVRIGFKGRIGSLYDGSKAAKVILDAYAQTRDAVLTQDDWDFAVRAVPPTLLKAAPATGYVPPTVWSTAYPSPPWLYSYAYPDDCLKVRSVQPTPVFVIDMDPQPNSFMVENDSSYNPPKKVILCNVAAPVLVYTAQVTNMTNWEPYAIEAFAAALARRIAPSLMGLESAKMEIPDEAQSSAIGMQEQD